MTQGFNGGMTAAPRGAGKQRFLTSGGIILPFADNYIIDVFGAGASGAVGSTNSAGGGGGARHRVYLPRACLIPGAFYPVIVGAGGAPVTGSGAGLAGGNSSFGSISLGQFIQAFGAPTNGCGAGIASSTSVGGPGSPTSYNTSTNVGAPTNATSDLGGATTGNGTDPGNAVWGGAAGASYSLYPNAGASIYGGSGGACCGPSYNGKGGLRGTYAPSGSVTAATLDGIPDALVGGGGSGGNSATSAGGVAGNGGFPSGGGGSSDTGTSGRGGNGLVVIYWW